MAQRGQRGSLRIRSGSFVGYYNTYVIDGHGQKQRRQKAIVLCTIDAGKWQARRLLQEKIDSEFLGEKASAKPDPKMSLEQFTRERWLPMMEPRWRKYKTSDGSDFSSTQSAVETCFRHIFKRLGKTPLEELDAVILQTWLNDLASDYSDSLVKHCRYYLKSILEQAVWEELLRKNPAKFLALPKTKAVAKTVLTKEQFTSVLAELNPRFSLLVRVAVFCAFRPSELLALRWQDFDAERKVFTIRETFYRGELRPFTKTTESDEKNTALLTVGIPDAIVEDLVRLRGPVTQIRDSQTTTKGYGVGMWTEDDDFIFASHRGTPYNKENILHRVFTPVRVKLKLPALNFQVLRRSCATWSQSFGSMKDLQTHSRHRNAHTTMQEYVQGLPESAQKMINAVYGEFGGD